MARVLKKEALVTIESELVSAKRVKKEPVVGAFYRYHNRDLRLCVTKQLHSGGDKPELMFVDPKSGKSVASDGFLRSGILDGTYQIAPDIVVVTGVEESV